MSTENEQYELSKSIVREHCEFWSQPTANQPCSGYFEILSRQVCAQGGIILHYYEDNQRSGVAVAAFSSGIRIYKTRGREHYSLTSEIGWEVLEQAKTHLSDLNQSDTA